MDPGTPWSGMCIPERKVVQDPEQADLISHEPFLFVLAAAQMELAWGLVNAVLMLNQRY